MIADSMDIVKYHAYLRKMTRYNPTRGGEPTLPTFPPMRELAHPEYRV